MHKSVHLRETIVCIFVVILIFLLSSNHVVYKKWLKFFDFFFFNIGPKGTGKWVEEVSTSQMVLSGALYSTLSTKPKPEPEPASSPVECTMMLH